jgi:hypothetical protein
VFFLAIILVFAVMFLSTASSVGVPSLFILFAVLIFAFGIYSLFKRR